VKRDGVKKSLEELRWKLLKSLKKNKKNKKKG
jgi:hypothetical protein